jgi:hypothetical protein
MNWSDKSLDFLDSIGACSVYPSVPGGKITLYGSCYANMARYYLSREPTTSVKDLECLIRRSYCPISGMYFGPELEHFSTRDGAKHDRDHLIMHLTCSAVLPVAQCFGICLEPILLARKWCEINRLKAWQDSIDWSHAWFEGNNILFVGQLLVYLRDVERNPGAAEAMALWFSWLDRTVDPKTGLWGTNGYCSPMEAVYGGYHQLLVYYYEGHPLPNIRGLVDTVLSLQHRDGGFNPGGNGGACEDVDSVDILVNCYKRLDYRRAEIRLALRRCMHHILQTQNPDGGFPYNRNLPQSHMGIPGTEAGPNVSCTFPTWFRIHTLALIAEVLPEEPELAGIPFRFNKHLSMGWHRSPKGWQRPAPNWADDQLALAKYRAQRFVDLPKRLARRGKRVVGSSLRQLGLRR